MDDIAVLYRNHSDARFVVEQLLTENIPFFLKEKAPNIYSHFIFSDLEAYFNIAIGNITRERMLRILNRPNRYFHRQSVEHDYSFNGMKRFYQNNSVMTNRVEELSRDINLISKMSPFAAANYIKGMMGYDRFLKEYSIEKDKEFQDLAEVFSFFMETVKDCKTIKKALEKINYLRLKIDFENKNKKQEKYGKIGLYTMHSSKGLEFKNVYIIGVNEGNIPSKKAKTIDEIEAERRLFYVGITRTKENLHISFVNTKNRDRAYPSRFIAELDIENYSSP